MKSVFIIAIAFVFSIFAISLGVIPADAVNIRGQWAEIQVDQIWEGKVPEGQQVLVTLTDQDLNKDPTIADIISFPTVFDPTTMIFDDGIQREPFGSIPTVSFPKNNNGDPTIGLLQDTTFSFNDVIWQSFGYSPDNMFGYFHTDYGFGNNVVVPQTPNSITFINNGDSLLLKNTIQDSLLLDFASESKIQHFLNYDFTSLNQKLSDGGINSFNITIEDDTGNSVILLDSTSNLKNYLLLDDAKINEIISTLNIDSSNPQLVDLRITFLNTETNSQYSPTTILPLYLDIFRFGELGDGSSWRDYILEFAFRLELEETGVDTGVFTGTIAYTKINEFNLETFDFASLITSGKNIVFPSFIESTDEDSIRIEYLDLGLDGVVIPVYAGMEIIGVHGPLPVTSITTNEDTPIHFEFASDKIATVDAGICDLGQIYYDSLTQDHVFEPEPNAYGNFESLPDQSYGTLSTSNDLCYTSIVESSIIGREIYNSRIPLSITVIPTDDPPTIEFTNQELSIVEDTITNIPIKNMCDDNLSSIIGCSPYFLYNSEIQVNNPDNDELTFSIVTNPGHGQITGTTELVYEPDLNYVGEDYAVVNFSDGISTTENVNVTFVVIPVNDSPIANAGPDQTVDSNSNVQLDGTNSLDPDDDAITYSWVQTSGYIVALTDNTSATPEFSVPAIDDTLTFQLTVSDKNWKGNWIITDSSPDVVNVIVGTVTNSIPIANAGVDQSVESDSVVTLDGSSSSDADGDIITYHWIQTAGYPTTLSDDTVVNPQLTSPSSGDTLSYMLTVSDGTATSNPDVINVYVSSSVPEPTLPPTPTSLNSNASDSTVVLTWQNSGDGGSTITDYVIEYKSANSSWSTYDDGVSSNTVSIISNLENNVSYQFRISAVNSVGTSDSSSLISATPISSAGVVEAPIVEAPIVEAPIVEAPITPQPEPSIPEPKLGIASFVDQTKDPQSYVDRYNNEPTYKEWFDENYSQY
ncbi:MAG: hypothetical protein HN875_01800, partial [Candidatus Nitrosopelagicus sp.]|nr:hypothetical protein [Candidatus Nitrosopelagicus sp.]